MLGTRTVDHSGQATIFDAIAAAKLRDEGMELAACKKGALLAFAREGIKRIAMARESREVTADDVQQFLVDNDLDEGCLGNAAGSVFRNPRKGPPIWHEVRRTKSKRKTAHARSIAVWKYVESEQLTVESGQSPERWEYTPRIPPEGNHLSGVGIQSAGSGFDRLRS